MAWLLNNWTAVLIKHTLKIELSRGSGEWRQLGKWHFDPWQGLLCVEISLRWKGCRHLLLISPHSLLLSLVPARWKAGLRAVAGTWTRSARYQRRGRRSGGLINMCMGLGVSHSILGPLWPYLHLATLKKKKSRHLLCINNLVAMTAAASASTKSIGSF